MHIQKTAGTTLRILLEQQLSIQEIYPYRNRMQAKGPVKHDLVSGHLPYWLCKELDEDFEGAFKITVLRDPVGRYLSFLRAKKKANSAFPDLQSVMNERLLSTKENNPGLYWGLIDNSLCRNLAASPNLEGQELLESAKQTLQNLDCVLFFDNFTQDVIDLFKRLGIDLDEKDIPKINVTEKEPVSAQLLEEVRQVNELDIQLYNYAKTCLGKKNTTYQLRTKSFDNLVKKTSDIDYSFDLPLKGREWSYREVTEGDTTKYSVYRWVMDRPSYIYFSLEEGFDYNLYFTAQPLTNEVVPRVSVNGKEIEILKVNDDAFSLYQGKIPRDCVTKALTEISFYASKALLYRDVHPRKKNRNHPPLSFAVNRIKISKK